MGETVFVIAFRSYLNEMDILLNKRNYKNTFDNFIETIDKYWGNY